MNILSNLDLNSIARIINLPDATDPQQPATKAQLDALVQGLAWKDNVRVATTANINLSSPGATINGLTMVNGDRVLVGTQTVGAENGIYVWNGASSAMTRSTDADSGAELNSAVVTVDEGTSAGSTYRQTAVSPTLGTTTITWAAFGTAAGAASETAAGIVELATTAETITGTDNTRAVTPAGLAGYTGFTKKYSTDIGDGSATSYTVTHNLNTRDVQIQVRKNSGDYGLVIVDAGAATVNTATIVFASAPTSNAYRVTVLA